MRKITLIAALLGLSFTMNAQSVKLQSAISDLRNGRLSRAKENIYFNLVSSNFKYIRRLN